MMFEQYRSHVAALAVFMLTTSAGLADTLTVNDITGGIPGVFEVNIPTLEITNGNVTEAEVRALFASGINAEVIEALAADSVAVPAWSWTYTMPEGQDLVEGQIAGEGRDLLLTSIKGGVIGSLIDAGQVIAYPEGGEMTSNRLEITGLNLPRVFRFLGLTESLADDTPQEVYSGLNYDGHTSKSMSEECSMSGLTTDALKVRPFKLPLLDIMVVQRKLSSRTPVDSLTLSKFYADVLTGVDLGSWTVSDHNCNSIVEGKAVQFSAENLSGEGFANGVVKAITADNFACNIDENYIVTASKFKLEAVDFSGLAAVFSDVMVMVDDQWIAANLRKFVVEFAGLSAENIALDFPDDARPENRIQVDVAKIDLAIGEYRNAIPTDIRFLMAGVKSPLPLGVHYQVFRDLGLEEIETSYLIDLNWNEADSTIIVDGLSISVKELGSIALSGTIGHASAALFSNNVSTAILAATSLTALDARLDAIDGGLLQKLLEQSATESKLPVEELRASMVGTATTLIPMLLNGNPATDQVSNAVIKFINGHPELTFAAKSLDPAGITLPELMAAESDPLSLLSKVVLTASNPGDMDDGGEAAANTSP